MGDSCKSDCTKGCNVGVILSSPSCSWSRRSESSGTSPKLIEVNKSVFSLMSQFSALVSCMQTCVSIIYVLSPTRMSRTFSPFFSLHPHIPSPHSSILESTPTQYIHLLFYFFILVGRVFANVAGDQGSILGRVIPKSLKMVLDTYLLITQHYEVRIKGKVEQSRERSSTLPYTSV